MSTDPTKPQIGSAAAAAVNIFVKVFLYKIFVFRHLVLLHV
jgi:hypothetical protein